jgi:hypothetical protein
VCANKRAQFDGAESVHRRGFFIGVHVERLSDSAVVHLVETLLGFDFENAESGTE